jgi:ribosomal protein S18 acetylase RimI-like enzyme
MRIKVRPMTVRDKPAVMAMLQDMPEFNKDEVAVAEEVVDDYLRESTKSGYHVFIAELDLAIAGYICYGPTPLTEATWDIYWLAVAPNQQRKGIGKHLLTLAEANIEKAGGRITIIETSSRPEYEATGRFYKTQGYELACRIADFYAPGDAKLILIKRLN